LGYGTARDLVLGMDVVNAQGRRIHGGGRVVKNVAGYDLPKMHIGALGTLGIIVEATLKLRPRPESAAGVVIGLKPSAVEPLFLAIRRSSLRPVGMDLLNPPAARRCFGRSDELTLVFLFEECQEAVDEQVQSLCDLLKGHGTPQVHESEEYATLVRRLVHSLSEVPMGQENAQMKACMRPTDVLEFFRESERLDPNASLHAHAGSGIVWGLVSPKVLPLLLDWVSHRSGSLIVTHWPMGCPRSVPTWGKMRSEHFLMERLRLALDPKRTINPGRYVVE
jgi:glycolate oxidase FAD binding subunit